MTPLKSSLLTSVVIPAALLAAGLVSARASNPAPAKQVQVAQNPCAARNPCAAANPCAARNPCNPCAAKNPCNPCAAKNPCNPCAAANPCNPCGAANPCNPCGAAAAAVELTAAEAKAVQDCLSGEMKSAYAKSGNKYAAVFLNWKAFSTQAYVSSTHGERYVMNYANAKAGAYGKYEDAGKMPAGAVLAKSSFIVNPQGRVSVGPLFLMEKHNAGFNRNSHDWQYTMIMPSGQVAGTTNGRGSAAMAFCYGCHNAVAEEQDALMFLPDEYRVK